MEYMYLYLYGTDKQSQILQIHSIRNMVCLQNRRSFKALEAICFQSESSNIDPTTIRKHAVYTESIKKMNSVIVVVVFY